MNGQVRRLSFAAIGGLHITSDGKRYSGSAANTSGDRSTTARPTGPFESMTSIMIRPAVRATGKLKPPLFQDHFVGLGKWFRGVLMAGDDEQRSALVKRF